MPCTVDTCMQTHSSPSWRSRPHSHASSTRWPFDAHSDERERREAPGEAACAAETGRPLLLFSRPLKQTHGASPNGQHAALHNAEHSVRGEPLRMLSGGKVAHAERRWRMHGGSKTHPAEAAPPLLYRSCWGGRHAACGWSEGGSQLLEAAAAPGRFIDAFHLAAAPR